VKGWVGLKRLEGLEGLEGPKSKSKSVSLSIPRAADGLDAGLDSMSRARSRGISKDCPVHVHYRPYCPSYILLTPPSADD
jgi:hypothetical protein